jgi:hypothetical protein
MKFYLVSYHVGYIKPNSDNFTEKVAHLRFLDTANFVNSNTFLSQLNSVKKVRITTVSWYLKEVDFKYNVTRISNTVH